MAAPSIVAGHTTKQDASATTSRTITTPTYSSGDRIFVVVASSIQNPSVGIAGFSEAYTGNISTVANLTVLYKTAGSEGASYTLTSSSCIVSAIAVAITGAAGIHVFGTDATGSSATATGPAITTARTDTLRICLLAADDSPGITTVATMTGHTLLATVTGSGKPTVSLQYKTLASAGADSSQTSALSGSEQWLGVTFAVANTAEDHATKAGVYVELGGAATFATKAGVYVEIIAPQARATMAGVYVEIVEPDTMRVTNLGAYIQVSADAPDGTPTDLTATATSSTTIDIDWTDNATNEDGYLVERSLNGSTWATIADIAADSNTYTDTGRTPCATYYYRVRAYNADGYSAYSNTDTALTFPPAPTIGTVSAGSPDDIAVDVTWTDNASCETYQVIQHTTTSGSGYVDGATIDADEESGTDSSLSPNTTYYFRVGACNASGCSYSAESSSITTGAPPQTLFDIAAKALFDWDHDGTFTDETDYLVSARGTQRIAPATQSITSTQGQVGQCTVVLDNSTGRFSSLNSGGALYSYIGEGKAWQVPVIVKVSSVAAGSAADYNNVFYGYARIPSEQTLAPGQAQTIAFDCRSLEDVLMNRKIRTTQAEFSGYWDDGVTESEFMDDLLTTAGAGLTSDLDDGMVIIPAPWLEKESVLESIWQVAAAAGGRFYGTPDGAVVYESAAHWIYSPHNTSQYTYSRGAGFGNLELVWNDSELAEEVSVSWNGKDIAASANIYDSKNIQIDAGDSKTVWADFSSPLYSITSISTTAGSPGGLDLSSDITVTPTYYAQSAKLVIANAGSIAANVRVKIDGKVTEDTDQQTVINVSSDGFWTSRTGRSRKLSGSRWIQTEGHARFVMDFIASRQELPTMMLRLSGCPGISDRRLGDRITVTDTKVGINDEFWVTSLTWSYSNQGFVQDMEVYRTSDLYTYVDSSPGYFIIGTNKLGAADAARGRCFF